MIGLQVRPYWSSRIRAPSPKNQAERPFLRPFLGCGGLRFPVSARRYRLQVSFWRVRLRRQESRSKLGEGVGGDWPTGPALLVFEDQSAKPEERHAADPDGLHCGFQRRTDLRFAIEGHEDEDQKERSHLKVGHVCPKDTLFFNATPKSSYHTVTAQFSARTPVHDIKPDFGIDIADCG